MSQGNSPLGWTDDNPAPSGGNFSIIGVYLRHPTLQGEGGFNGRQRVRIGPGSGNTGSFWSFGSSASTERALGLVDSNTIAGAGVASHYGLRFTNNTGVNLTQFTLAFNGEQWRDGGAPAPAPQQVTFSYSTDATSIDVGTFQSVPALDFTSPGFENAGAGTAVNGNVAGRTAISPVNVALNWMPGTDLWLRWSDVNDTGNDHGLAIDDIEFSAQVVDEAILGDFDDDSDVDVTDYLTLSTHLFTDVSSLTVAQSYMMGDITRDLKIDGRDFSGFYRAYDDFNGLGAFVAMLAGVPEPSAGALAAIACLGFGSRRRLHSRRGST